jgi:hypothetical protein
LAPLLLVGVRGDHAPGHDRDRSLSDLLLVLIIAQGHGSLERRSNATAPQRAVAVRAAVGGAAVVERTARHRRSRRRRAVVGRSRRVVGGAGGAWRVPSQSAHQRGAYYRDSSLFGGEIPTRHTVASTTRRARETFLRNRPKPTDRPPRREGRGSDGSDEALSPQRATHQHTPTDDERARETTTTTTVISDGGYVVGAWHDSSD